MILQVKQIADRVRELREILDIPAETVAEKIGVSTKVYANYENAEIDIPIGKLYQIADVLETDPTVLLIGDSPRMAEFTVVRGGNGIHVERFPGYSFTSLAYNYIGREMEPMLVTLEPGAVAEPVTHKGQEFNMVLKGSVMITIGFNKILLATGDSIYFNPELPHSQHAVGEEPAVFLTVINE